MAPAAQEAPVAGVVGEGGQQPALLVREAPSGPHVIGPTALCSLKLQKAAECSIIKQFCAAVCDFRCSQLQAV
eukprot:10795668-Alexandrium_andersonii.AAC.1